MIQLVNDTFIIQGKEHYLLSYFINNNKEEVIKWLINLPNIDVNIQNQYNVSPLCIAISNYDINSVELLLNHQNINVNLQNQYDNNFSPLHYVITMNIIELNENDILILLLNYSKINVNLQNSNNDTPLHLLINANTNNNEEIYLLLNNQNINVNLQNKYYETPLHLALLKKNYDVVKILIEKTNISITNNKRQSILSLYCIILIQTQIISDIEQEIMILILNKFIDDKMIISIIEYGDLSCWSTINNITLNIFNNFITKYHINFPDLKIRYEIASNYYDLFTHEYNNKQYLINGHGKTINNYFIIPSNMIIIMHTPINEIAYYF